MIHFFKELQQKDGGHFSSHDVLVKRVQASFNKIAESTEQSCRERCMEDLEGTTRYVTWSLHNKNRAGLRHFLDSFVALEQLSVNTHTAHSTGLLDQSSGLNDNKQDRSKGDSISFHSSDANSPAPVSEARLVDLLYSTLWNRRLAPSSERLVYALVHQIFHGIKEHFLVTTELKFNCFLLMPIVDKLPALLRKTSDQLWKMILTATWMSLNCATHSGRGSESWRLRPCLFRLWFSWKAASGCAAGFSGCELSGWTFLIWCLAVWLLGRLAVASEMGNV